MTSSTLTHPGTAAAALPTTGPTTGPAPDADGCTLLVVELCEPGTTLDALAKVVVMLRGRRWDVRSVEADLGTGVVRLSVRTERAELLTGLLERVAVVGSVRAG